MESEEKEFSNHDYMKLVERLVNSENVEEVMESASQPIAENPNFYLMLFKTVDVIRANEVSKGRQNVVDLLDQVKIKLYDYNNGIPMDLPKSVLDDRNLKTMYLGDYPGVGHVSEKWDAFQYAILDKMNSIPQRSAHFFLYWCDLMLSVNLVRHNQRCKDPSDCPVNRGYDRRMQYIIRLIEDMTPRPVQDVSQSASAQDPVKKSSNKIQWLGNQKELAELFIMLRAKGWIVDFEIETIKDSFTNSHSIQQYLKAGDTTGTGELGGTFEQVFTSEYVPKFHGIKGNPKKN